MFASQHVSGSASAGGVVLFIFLVLAGIALYFLPTFIARLRDGTNVGGVFVLNFLVGWTFVGWIVALYLAVSQRTKHDPQPVLMYPPPPPQGYAYPSPPLPGTPPQGYPAGQPSVHQDQGPQGVPPSGSPQHRPQS